MNTIDCAAGDCERASLPRGQYCDMHQQRMRRNGHLRILDPWREMTTEERFWARVDRRGKNDCWLWTGELNNMGYGIFCTYLGGRRKRNFAHRYSLKLVRDFADEMKVLHSCDNPRCVNPEHLRPGTQLENIRDAISRGRANTAGLEAWWERRRSTPVRYCHCGQRARSRGMCGPHYMHWWRAERERKRLNR